MLKRITTHDIEPADLDVELAPRLNLLAGDNGLGKTFLLDLAWWSLTGTWAHRPAIPKRGQGVEPRIACEAGTQGGDITIEGSFGFEEQTWGHREPWPSGKPARSRFENEHLRLVISARTDGTVDIWDSYRASIPSRLSIWAGPMRWISLDAQKIWDGLFNPARGLQPRAGSRKC